MAYTYWGAGWVLMMMAARCSTASSSSSSFVDRMFRGNSIPPPHALKRFSGRGGLYLMGLI